MASAGAGQTAFDGGLYALGQKDELKGTGVWGFIKMTRNSKPAEAAKKANSRKQLKSDKTVTYPKKANPPSQSDK
eukprot:jgi/Tetstr1/466420/TSEL_010948.t1